MGNRSDVEKRAKLSLTLLRKIFLEHLVSFKNSESLQQTKLIDLPLWLTQFRIFQVHKSFKLSPIRSATKNVFHRHLLSRPSKIKSKTGLLHTSEATQLWSLSIFRVWSIVMKNCALQSINNANRVILTSKRLLNSCTIALKLKPSSRSKASSSKNLKQSSRIFLRWGREMSAQTTTPQHKVVFCKQWQILASNQQRPQIRHFWIPLRTLVTCKV